MGKHADIEPRWLVSLLCQWVRHDMAKQDGSLGYPSKAAFLTIGSAKMVRTDPTEFCARDYRQLEAAIETMRVKKPHQWAALMMYYKPWTIDALKGEGWPFGDKTYYNRLHAVHRDIAEILDFQQQKVLAEE